MPAESAAREKFVADAVAVALAEAGKQKSHIDEPCSKVHIDDIKTLAELPARLRPAPTTTGSGNSSNGGGSSGGGGGGVSGGGVLVGEAANARTILTASVYTVVFVVTILLVLVALCCSGGRFNHALLCVLFCFVVDFNHSLPYHCWCSSRCAAQEVGSSSITLSALFVVFFIYDCNHYLRHHIVGARCALLLRR
jgi:hypothetical protein